MSDCLRCAKPTIRGYQVGNSLTLTASERVWHKFFGPSRVVRYRVCTACGHVESYVDDPVSFAESADPRENDR